MEPNWEPAAPGTPAFDVPKPPSNLDSLSRSGPEGADKVFDHNYLHLLNHRPIPFVFDQPRH